MFERHIEPTLGAWTLRNMTVNAVESWFAGLDAGPEAKAKAARILRALTGYAYRRGLIVEDPARILSVAGSAPRSLRPEEIPTREQVARLAAEVGD